MLQDKQDKIDALEEKITNSTDLTAEQQSELLKLLAKLKIEVQQLSQTHAEHAESIAGYTQASAYEAMQHKRDEKRLEHSIEELKRSVKTFEVSHPDLV